MSKNRRCPVCRSQDRDNGSDDGHMFLMQDKETWACYRRDIHPDGKPYFERGGDSTPPEHVIREGNPGRETMGEIENYPPMSFTYRGIRKETWKHFDVKCSFSEVDGSLSFLYFPIKEKGSLVGYHVRDVNNKKFHNVGGIAGRKIDLFGLDKCAKSGKALVITEGHLDALSVFQIMYDKAKNKAWLPNVTSLNNGTGSASQVGNNRDTLMAYDKVLLSFDMDEAGEKAVSAVSKILGPIIRVMELSAKDANEALESGKVNEVYSAFFNAREYIPSDIVTLGDVYDDILKETEPGMPYPWDGLNEITYGVFDRNIISVGAAAGAGKTVWMNQLSSYFIKEYRKKIALFSLEETPAYTAKKLIGSLIQKRIHLPGIPVTKREIQKTFDELKDYLYIYDTQGFLSWEDIKNNIRYLASLGVSIFVIDPLTAVTATLNASEANEMLNSMMAELAGIVQSLGISVFLVSHLNNPKTGKMHSEGGRVSGEQFTQSRAMYRWSHYVFGLERNLQSDDEDEKNTLIVRVIKNRPVGKTGTVALKYEEDTGRLNEIDTEIF